MRGVFLAHGAVTELYAREDLHLLVRNATIGYTGRRQGHGKSIGSIQRDYTKIRTKNTDKQYRELHVDKHRTAETYSRKSRQDDWQTHRRNKRKSNS